MMGFNSVLFICNDAMDQISKDPAGWWEKTKGELMTLSRPDKDGSYGFGNHANGFQAVTNRHADETVLIAAGQNCATVIGSDFCNWNHHKKEGQIRLLKHILKELEKEQGE